MEAKEQYKKAIENGQALAPKAPVDPKLAMQAEFWAKKEAKRKERAQHRRNRAIFALTAELKRPPKEREIKARIFLIAEEARKQWLLREGRATIAELIQAKQPAPTPKVIPDNAEENSKKSSK